jgi:flagellar biosynthesis GTPase FlhF
MTQHKVIAEDSLSAMDEISRVLGKDAVILKTEKINGKIHILGSNNIEDLATSNAKKINKHKSNFSHLFSNKNLNQKLKIEKFNQLLKKKISKTTIFSLIHKMKQVVYIQKNLWILKLLKILLLKSKIY